MRKILVINLGGIGDLLLSTPSLRALRSFSQEDEISLLVTPQVYNMIQDLSYIDKVFDFEIKCSGLMPFGIILKNLKTLVYLRKKHFDLAINMRTIISKKSAAKIKFLLDIINPKKKLGRDTEGRGYFFDIRISENLVGTKPEMEYDIDAVKMLGVAVVDRSIQLEVDREAEQKLDNILVENGASGQDMIIGIHPGGLPSRRWPIENFSKVVNEISKRISCKFIVTGDKKEAGLANILLKLTNKKIINLAGRLNIKELVALIKKCKLFISNNTGPIHIAAIFKTPLIAIFGPGDLIRYDPRYIFPGAVVLHKKTDCVPCYKFKCRSLKCLKKVSCEEVIEHILSNLAC